MVEERGRGVEKSPAILMDNRALSCVNKEDAVHFGRDSNKFYITTFCLHVYSRKNQSPVSVVISSYGYFPLIVYLIELVQMWNPSVRSCQRQSFFNLKRRVVAKNNVYPPFNVSNLPTGCLSKTIPGDPLLGGFKPFKTE